MNNTKTLIKCRFKYKGKEYSIEEIIPYYLDEESAAYLYKEGSYSDDDHRADLIRIKYGNDAIPNLPVGSAEIELINIKLEHK
jgi:hypothetical protein